MNTLTVLALVLSLYTVTAFDFHCVGSGQGCTVDDRCCPGFECVNPDNERTNFGICKPKSVIPQSASVHAFVGVGKRSHSCSHVGGDCGGLYSLRCCDGVCQKESNDAFAWGTCVTKHIELKTQSSEDKTCARYHQKCGGKTDLKCCHGVCLRHKDAEEGTCYPWLNNAEVQKKECSILGSSCGGKDDVKCCGGGICIKHSNEKDASGLCWPILKTGDKCSKWGQECGGQSGLKCCRGGVCLRSSNPNTWGYCSPILASTEKKVCSQIGDTCDVNGKQCCNGFCMKLSGSQNEGRCVALPQMVKQKKEVKSCGTRGDSCGGVTGMQCCSDQFFCLAKDHKRPELGGRCMYYLRKEVNVEPKNCGVRNEVCGGKSGLQCCSDRFWCKIDHSHPEKEGRCEYWL